MRCLLFGILFALFAAAPAKASRYDIPINGEFDVVLTTPPTGDYSSASIENRVFAYFGDREGSVVATTGAVSSAGGSGETRSYFSNQIGAGSPCRYSSSHCFPIFLNLFQGATTHIMVGTTIDVFLAFNPTASASINLPDGFQLGNVVDFAASVPESSTWAMMIFGFIVVGGMAYRRRQNLSA